MWGALGAAVLGWLLLATLIMIGRHGATLRALWREPVLRRPVLIFESDDWGPGDATHAEALRRLCEILGRYRDAEGHHPVMTLGMVLALPDRERMRVEKKYVALSLADARYAELRSAIEEGVRRGVFAVQLHGKEHYWPPALMVAAQRDEIVRAWLESDTARTEDLPAPLQSRWIDASVLPSQVLDDEEIAAAVDDEVGLFKQIFGHAPCVVVPPTFVWNRAVENVWAKCGVRVLVTPGARFESRDAAGKVIAGGRVIRNGEPGAQGLIYLVRDRYFEPARGHRAEQALAALQLKSVCGRPTLLETHRYNYVGDPATAERAYEELARTLEQGLRAYPSLRFTSTEQLATMLRERHGEWVDGRCWPRIGAWCRRLRQERGLWRDLRLMGLAWMISVLQRLSGSAMASTHE